MSNVVTTTEAADLVGVSPITIRSWIERGHLTPLRAEAKPLLFRERDVIECHLARMTKAQHEALDALWREVLDSDVNEVQR